MVRISWGGLVAGSSVVTVTAERGTGSVDVSSLTGDGENGEPSSVRQDEGHALGGRRQPRASTYVTASRRGAEGADGAATRTW